jgi:undecaprenyl-diphosphatase
VDHGLPTAATETLTPQSRFELRVVLVGLAVSLVGIPFGLLVHQVTTNGPLTQLDESFAQWLHERLVGNAFAKGVLEFVSFTGKPIFLIPLIGLPCLWLLRNGARKLVVFLIVASVGGGIVDTLVKIAVGRPRPKFDQPITTAFGNSFPSGHSMSSLICYGALLLVFMPLIPSGARRIALALTSFWVLAIGVSRLALGVHYISDVLGGYVLGAAWLIGLVAAFEVWREDRGKRPTHVLDEGVEPEEARRALD